MGLQYDDGSCMHAGGMDPYVYSYTYGINMMHAQIAKTDVLSHEELVLVSFHLESPLSQVL